MELWAWFPLLARFEALPRGTTKRLTLGYEI